MQVVLDHVTTYADVEDLTAHLAHYRAVGFDASSSLVAHAHGVMSGVLRFGTEYVELLGIEDFDAFNKAPMNDKIMYSAFRPFAIAFKVEDLEQLRTSWIERGIDVPAIEVLRAHEPTTSSVLEWKLLQIPLKLMRGASCFVIEKSWRAGTPAPNGTYELAAVTLVSEDARDRCAQWRQFLAPDSQDSDQTIELGAHRVFWRTPAQYAERFGRSWTPAKHPLGEIAVVHLLTDDLERTRLALEAGSRPFRSGPGPASLLVEPLPEDNVAFAIHHAPQSSRDRVEHWAGV